MFNASMMRSRPSTGPSNHGPGRVIPARSANHQNIILMSKRLTKWEIATKIDEFQRDLGEHWRMPIGTWIDTYTRQELVDYFNHMVRIHYMGRKEIA